MEPYKNRTATNLRRDIEYLLDFYGTHAAFYRYFRKNAGLMLLMFLIVYVSLWSQWNKIIG